MKTQSKPHDELPETRRDGTGRTIPPEGDEAGSDELPPVLVAEPNDVSPLRNEFHEAIATASVQGGDGEAVAQSDLEEDGMRVTTPFPDSYVVPDMAKIDGSEPEPNDTNDRPTLPVNLAAQAASRTNDVQEA